MHAHSAIGDLDDIDEDHLVQPCRASGDIHKCRRSHPRGAIGNVGSNEGCLGASVVCVPLRSANWRRVVRRIRHEVDNQDRR